MICIVGFSLLLFYKGMLCEKVTQSSPDKIVESGSEVTLPCTYDSEYSDPDLYWYRIRPDRSFQFILYRDGTRALDVDFTQGRFSVQHSQTHETFNLVISSVRTEDRATYYCGIPDYSTGISDKLIFGTGTQLIVEAKSQPPAKPSVFVMRNGTNVACLVKDFYPKNININLQSSKKIIEYDPAIVISPSGKYNAVKLGQYGDSNSVKCSVQHNNEIVYSTETEQTTNSPGDLKPTEPVIIQQTSESCHEPKVLSRKVNMTSLTLLGLRLLFIKTVAVNFLLTAKLFFC